MPTADPVPRPVALAVAAVALAAVALAAVPASAHPFGPPPTAVVSAQGETVAVRWRAATDDMLAIGERLGVLPAGSADRFREAAVQVAPPAAAEEALDASPALARYLTERIAVFQDGERCAVTVAPISDFVGQGATTRHHCSRPVTTVELEITMLHDVHDAYRTFAVDASDREGAGQSVHTLAEPRARWTFTDGVGRTGPPEGTAAPADDGFWPLEGRFVELIDRPASPWLAMTGLLLAFGIGAVHALAPGHGKAVAAAALVGARARPRDALALAGAVAVMHTASVLVLALSLHALAVGGTLLDRAGPWLTVVAGLLVLAVGAGSLLRVLRHRRGVDTDGAHRDSHRHRHTTSAARRVTPLSRRGLTAIGLSGGLLPSPSAFLVLTTALFTGRTLFGLALVAAFGIGLAATIALIGLAVLRGRDLAGTRVRGPRLTAALDALPLASALLITVAGVWLTVAAVARL